MSLSPFEGEKHIGSASIQTAASKSLILTDFSSFKRLAELEKRVSYGGLYQASVQTLSRGLQSNQALADFATRLASMADHAYLIREFEFVGYAGQLLLSLPLSRQAESMGHYYRALGLRRSARGDIARADSMFEQVADNASSQYRARGMLALGTNSVAVGDCRTAMSFYREVVRILTRNRIFDPMSFYVASRMTAVVRAVEGDHRGAIADLERMFPLVRMASSIRPYAYYDYLNTLAVELAETGRLEEARNASQIALASPFAGAYPDWRDTRDEIELRGWRASRSTIAFSQRGSEATNLVRLRVPEPSDGASHEESIPRHTKQRARVLDLLEWKNKWAKSQTILPKIKRASKKWTAERCSSRSWSLPVRGREPMTNYYESWRLLKGYCQNRKIWANE